jgi:hypothetical protein
VAKAVPAKQVRLLAQPFIMLAVVVVAVAQAVALHNHKVAVVQVQQVQPLQDQLGQ